MLLRSPPQFKNRSPSLPLRKPQIARRIAIAVLIFAGLLTGLLIVFPRQFIHQVQISLIRQPTPYTQLFFSDPTALPTQLHVNRRDKFAFTIVNDEGRSQFYQYIVTMTPARSYVVVVKGTMALPNGGTGIRAVNVQPKFRQSRYLINVVIAGTGQSIHFYGDTP
jgi:hypothetical protein